MTFVSDGDDEDALADSGVRSRLPASKMDTSHNIINLTPSGEVQMRVTGTVSGTNESTPRLSQRATEPQNNLTAEREDEVVDLVKLRQELAIQKEAEIRIQNLLNSQSGDEGRTSCGGGDGIEHNKVIPGLPDNGRRQQDGLRGQHVDQCFGPGTNSPWQVSPNMCADGYGLSVQADRNRCVGTSTYSGHPGVIVWKMRLQERITQS